MVEDLRSARRSAGWSQRTLAERVGVDPQLIKRLRKGAGSMPTLTAAMSALDSQLTGLGPGKALPDQLRARRRKLSLSLEQVSTRTGPSRTTIANLKRGGDSVARLVRLPAVKARYAELVAGS